MGDLLPIRLNAVVLECRDPAGLSGFYRRMLGWEEGESEGDGWVEIEPPGGGQRIAFQRNEDFVPPVWPDEPGAQQMTAHLDFRVGKDRLQEAAAHAAACGAKLAETQYSDHWIVLIDPEGHPFCFV
jgi:catechol 2,3-dioxygenase-like lactoylglutathione lyase family enzyme